MPEVRHAPRRWLVTTLVMIGLALAVIGLALWNVSLVQHDGEQQKTIDRQAATIAAIQTQRETDRRAQVRAENITKVAQCYDGARSGPQLSRVLGLISILGTNQAQGFRGSIRTDPDNPLTPQRERNLERVEIALSSLRAFILNIDRQTPTVVSCDKLAKKLKVNAVRLREEASG